MKERICWGCKHIEVSEGWGGTDVTPGDPNELFCSRGHWDLFSNYDVRGRRPNPKYLDLEACLRTAEICPDWEEVV